MSLLPSAQVALGNQRFDAHVVSAAVCLAPLPAPSWFRVVLPAAARPEAAPGDAASLSLDGGEGAATVLTGRLRRLQRGVLGIEAFAADASADLAAFRPVASFQRKEAAEVVRALCDSAGIEITRIDLDLALAAYAAHPWRTASEQIAELSSLAGAMAQIDAEGGLVIEPPAQTAEAALRYGREIIECRQGTAAPSRAAQYLVGWGPAGNVDAPDALRPTVDVVPADAPAPGPDARRLSAALLRTPTAGRKATEARQAEDAARSVTLRAHCFLLPNLRPGMVIEVQDLPEGFQTGPWLLLRVTHRLPPRGGASTLLEARATGAGARDLLADLAGAIGGLL